MGVSPPRPLKVPVFGVVTAGLPRRVSCHTAAQALQDVENRGEACALANSGCLMACLTARTGDGGATGGQTRALQGRRAQGSTPATVLLRGHYPGPLPG